MAVKIKLPGAPVRQLPRPVPVGPARPRKVALLGGSPTSIGFAPWEDPTWEFWAHASIMHALPGFRVDRIFDTHPKAVFTIARKNGFDDYYGWLKTCAIPVYMQEHYQAIPTSVKYPLDRIRQQFGYDTPLGSQTAEMIALALYEGVTMLGFFGIDYSHELEDTRKGQRSNAEHWAGIAKGAGVQLVIPKTSPFCHEPVDVYGYESHTPEKYEARLEAVRQHKAKLGPQGPPFDPARLTPMTKADVERARATRMRHPAWAEAVNNFTVDDELPPELVAELEAALHPETA